MAKMALHAFVSGRVQGVFYRDSTRRKAQELKITGWVKNLNDGRVEVLACGEKKAVLLLKEWLWQGPPAATVDNIIDEEVGWENFTTFEIYK